MSESAIARTRRPMNACSRARYSARVPCRAWMASTRLRWCSFASASASSACESPEVGKTIALGDANGSDTACSTARLTVALLASVDDLGVEGLVQIHVVRERVEREALEPLHLAAKAAQRLDLGAVAEPLRRQARRRAFQDPPDFDGVEGLGRACSRGR